MTAETYPWLTALAAAANAARLTFEESAASLGEVVLRRPDELHVRPSGTAFAGVHTVTLRRGGDRSIQVSAHLDPLSAPTRAELERQIGAGEPLLVSPDQIGEFDYRVQPAPEWQLPEQSSGVLTVGRGDRVTAVVLELPPG